VQVTVGHEAHTHPKRLRQEVPGNRRLEVTVMKIEVKKVEKIQATSHNMYGPC
jgi:hypothetical protein